MGYWLKQVRNIFSHTARNDEGGGAVAVAADTIDEPRKARARQTDRGTVAHVTKTLAETLGCSPEEIAKKQSGASAGSEDWQQVQERLRDLKQIPALKSLAQKFAQTLGGQVVEISEVVAAISHDPGLCIRILKMANSVAVASREPVKDLNTAVQLLGVDRVRLLANALLLQRDGESIVEGFDWKHLWMHALATAMLAEKLDRWSNFRAGPVLPVCAILHDVGKIALSVVVPDVYRDVLVTAWQQRQPLPALEQSRLGMDHREAGWTFASEAGLPAVVMDTIAFHDDPHRAHPDNRSLVALVGVANHWAKLYGLGFSGDASIESAEIWETPAWAKWQSTLPLTLDVDTFILKEEAWIEDVRRELQVFHD
jgi:HD-like signal output (HDOD) protein